MFIITELCGQLFTSLFRHSNIWKSLRRDRKKYRYIEVHHHKKIVEIEGFSTSVYMEICRDQMKTSLYRDLSL